MLRPKVTGRTASVLIAACLISMELGLCIPHTDAGVLPKLFWHKPNGAEAASCAAGSRSVPACNGEACCQERTSHSTSMWPFGTRRRKLAMESPEYCGWCRELCPPYVPPTFSVYQSSWTVVPYDGCHVPYDECLQFYDTPLPPQEVRQSPHDARQSMNGAMDSQCQPLQKTEVPATPPATQSAVLPRRLEIPKSNVAADHVPVGVLSSKRLTFDEKSPDALFTSQNDPFFQTKPGSDTDTILPLD